MHKELLRQDRTVILLFGAFSGAAATLATAPFNYPLLGWISLWPLFYLAERLKFSVRKLILAGISAAFFTCLFGFHWVIYLFTVFGGLHWSFSAILFLPYSIASNLKFPLLLLSIGFLKRSKKKTVQNAATPFAWALFAVLFDRFTPQIFPWYWGNLIAGNPYLSQIAELTGVLGLSFLLFYISAALYEGTGIELFLRSRFDPRRPDDLFHFTHAAKQLFVKKEGWPALLLLIISFTFGVVRKGEFERIEKGLPTVRVAILQTNTPLERPGGKQILTPESIHALIEETIPDLAHRAATTSDGKLDLIVLPESSVPYYSTDDSFLGRKTNLYDPVFHLLPLRLAYRYDTDLFLNDITIRAKEIENGRLIPQFYNSSVLFSRRGIPEKRYDKRVLVAFGEYVPGIELLDALGLSQFLPQALRFSGFAQGEHSTSLPFSQKHTRSPRLPASTSVPEDAPIDPEQFRETLLSDRTFEAAGTFVPLICYEVLFGEHVRTFFTGDQDPGFLVNITQDGWYGNGIETYQHFDSGRIRAIEFRRALVRSTNSGTSGFVDLAGNYVTPTIGPPFSPLETEEFQVWDVPIATKTRTLYSRYGERWIYFLAILFAFSVAIRGRIRKEG